MYKGLIYKVTCKITNKIYIGQTITPLKQRKNCHIWAARNKISKTEHFHNAIRKYGENEFVWEVIEIIETQTIKERQDVLNEREIYYISKYDSYKSGYNTTPGGHSGVGEFNKKAVKVYTEDGKLIGLFDSAKEGGLFYHIDASGIGKCCKRKLQTCGKNEDGYRLIWRYVEDDYTQEDMDNLDPIFVELYKYPNMEYLETFSSQKEAYECYKINKSTLNQILKGNAQYTKMPDGTKITAKYKKWIYEEGSNQCF